MIALTLAGASLAGSAAAAEPAACLSPDPSQWPASAKPYFMLVVDTSGSMTACTTPPTTYPQTCNQAAPGYKLNSCGLIPTRLNDAKCALRKSVQAFSGEANFGLATFAVTLSGCGAGACGTSCGDASGQDCNNEIYSCTRSFFPGVSSGCGNYPSCGTGPTPTPPNLPGGGWLNGANVVVGLQQDAWWMSQPTPSNVPELLKWFDGMCDENKEIFAFGSTPIAGSLRSTAQYLRAGWSLWTTTDYCSPLGYTFSTPLDAQDRACRSVNVLLVTDGDDNCGGTGVAVSAASDLLNNGVTLGGKTWPVRTYVVNFAGGSQVDTDAIANAGGTGASKFATNEVELSKALSSIIAGAIKPEVCDNSDNNCNGCTDEGSKHYCNVQPTAGQCCTLARDTCLANYKASITPANPQGDLTLLPCTTTTQQQDPQSWLCFDPGEKCDNTDNNCQNGVDEGVVKCGNPLHCPTTETCNGQDDDCDGFVDEGVCTNNCVPSPEICDGCDNDCDGVADNGIAPIPCGQTTPANCAGQITCPSQPVPLPGGCASGGGFSACNNSPQTETCDGIDNNCNGQIDDGVTPVPCEVPGKPGLIYGGTSQCQMGLQPCNGTCQGYVGPSAEICDGIDNDCDGQVDEDSFGVGQPCGINQMPCSLGTTVCVNGALVCQGGVQPQAEVCDGIDNDCDGKVDDAPLADGPLPGQNGCWNLPVGNCSTTCTFENLQWCAPPGATCNDNGTLSPPCNKGVLACNGAAGWICQNPKGPSAEVCDGLDNDCNGNVDDGNIPQVGQPCGTDTGECQAGTLTCTAGVLDCANDIPPSPESCDGLDNDCDGNIDNGIPSGGPCVVPYDTMAYPGDRSFAPCQPGIQVCNGMGSLTCVGGVGPSPELCDGIDNDCDGQVDEPGAAPDGLNGTPNPLPPPNANIGDACGGSVGECKQGQYACVNGLFACLGSQAPGPEQCDCLDNDCDGNIDNPNPNGPPLCGTGKTCVKSSNGCQCAAPCGSGEFPCPAGQTCEQVTDQNGDPLGFHCVLDPNAVCGDCTKKTVKDANGEVVCAPAGTTLPGCITPPVCMCKGQNGCQDPCFGVTCQAGESCAPSGPKAGQCVLDNCFNIPCQGCDKVCNLGACVDNPCKPDSCPTGEVCKPKDNFTSFECVKSCAGVVCDNGKVCKDGMCIDTCPMPCASGEVCDTGQSTPACVADKCQPNPCTNGACCDPVTGTCGNCPCEGVVCPAGQACQDGQCFDQGGTGGAGGAGGAGGGGSSSSASSSSSTSTGAGGTGGAKPDQIWGLATGGGGCSCETGPGAASLADGRLALLALALVAARRRRKRDDASAEEVAS